MRNIIKLGVLALAISSGAAHAAYTNLAPPAGWSAGGSAAWAAPSNGYAAQTANQWISNAARSSAMLNVGGRQIAVPAAMKLAPSAGRVMAGLVFASPHLRAAAGIASWLGVAGLVWDGVNNRWTAPNTEYEQSSGYFYKLTIFDLRDIQYSTPQNACDAYIAFKNKDTLYGYELTACSYGPTTGNLSYRQFARNSGNTTGTGSDNFSRVVSSCPAGWYITPGGCVQTPPPRMVTQAEMADLLNPNNQPGWPSSVPNEFPLGTPLPVAPPVINPDTGVNPFPSPLFVPNGDPVKNPSYDPAKPQDGANLPYLQPGTRVTQCSYPG